MGHRQLIIKEVTYTGGRGKVHEERHNAFPLQYLGRSLHKCGYNKTCKSRLKRHNGVGDSQHSDAGDKIGF